MHSGLREHALYSRPGGLTPNQDVLLGRLFSAKSPYAQEKPDYLTQTVIFQPQT